VKQHKQGSHLRADGFGSGRRRSLDGGHRGAVGIDSLVPTQVGQEGAELGHRDGKVVPVAGQEILEDLGGRLGLGLALGVVVPLGQHVAHRTQQHDKEQHQMWPVEPDDGGGGDG